MSEFRIKLTADLDDSAARSKLQSLLNGDNKIKLSADASNVESELKQILSTMRQLESASKSINLGKGLSGGKQSTSKLLSEFKALTNQYNALQKQLSTETNVKSASVLTKQMEQVGKSIDEAKNKINQWFKSELKEENILKGKDTLVNYAKAHGINFNEVNRPEYQAKILRKYGFRDWNTCLATIGHGGLKESHVVNRMYEDYKKDHALPVTDQDILDSVGEKQPGQVPEKKSKSGIVVKGLYDVAVHFSKCCSPVPGDEIVGFVTRGRGISIHRTDCINIINLSQIEKSRLIEAEWQEDVFNNDTAEYQAELKIFCNDRSGLLVDISKVFMEKEININSINSKTSKQGIATIEVFFNIKGSQQIGSLVEKIRQIDNVIDVERTTG